MPTTPPYSPWGRTPSAPTGPTGRRPRAYELLAPNRPVTLDQIKRSLAALGLTTVEINQVLGTTRNANPSYVLERVYRETWQRGFRGADGTWLIRPGDTRLVRNVATLQRGGTPPSLHQERRRAPSRAALTAGGGLWPGQVPNTVVRPNRPAPVRGTPGYPVGVAQPITGTDLDLGTQAAGEQGFGADTGTGPIFGDIPPDPGTLATGETNIMDWLAEHYGYFAAYLDHPEIGPILRRAAAENWGPGQLEAAIRATDYFRQTSETARQWDLTTTQDPGEAQRRRSQMRDGVTLLAEQLGVPITRARVAALSEDALRLAWDQNQIQRAVVAEARFGQTRPGGIQASADQVKALAASWLVPISDQSAFQWATAINTGAATAEGFQSYLAGYARQRFPDLAHQIDSGLSPSVYFDPLVQTVSQTLELPEGEINLNDPRWAPLTGFTDDRGVHRTMNQWEAQQWARNQPEFATTGAANQAVERFGYGLRQMWGFTA